MATDYSRTDKRPGEAEARLHAGRWSDIQHVGSSLLSTPTCSAYHRAFQVRIQPVTQSPRASKMLSSGRVPRYGLHRLSLGRPRPIFCTYHGRETGLDFSGGQRAAPMVGNLSPLWSPAQSDPAPEVPAHSIRESGVENVSARGIVEPTYSALASGPDIQEQEGTA